MTRLCKDCTVKNRCQSQNRFESFLNPVMGDDNKRLSLVLFQVTTWSGLVSMCLVLRGVEMRRPRLSIKMAFTAAPG